MKNKKYFVLLVHLLAWGILVAANIYVAFIEFDRYNFLINIVGVAVSPIIFYLNFSFFIKRFLFQKKVLQFILFSGTSFILITFFAFITVRHINENRWDNRRQILTEKYAHSEDVTIENLPAFNPKFTKRIIMQDTLETIYLLLSIYAISIIVPFLIRWYDTEKRLAKQEKEKIESELKFLKSQINPHFLFNSLNNIYALASRKSENTTDAILKLSSILRYILYEATVPSISIGKEVEQIKNYIELQKLRFTDKVKLNANFDIPEEEREIEPLLIIPIIENVFKYGVDTEKESVIEIKLVVKGDNLKLETKNNITRGADVLEGESGIGMKNVIRRLELTYGNNASLNHFTRDKQFFVELNINLTKHAMYSS